MKKFVNTSNNFDDSKFNEEKSQESLTSSYNSERDAISEQIEKLRVSRGLFSWGHSTMYWGYGFNNAMQVIKSCIFYTDIFDMLTTLVFEGALCCHVFLEQEKNNLGITNDDIKDYPIYTSGKSPEQYYKSLSISSKSYNIFVCSALLFVVDRLVGIVIYDNIKLKNYLFYEATYSIAKIFFRTSGFNQFIMELLLVSKFFQFELNKTSQAVFMYLRSFNPEPIGGSPFKDQYFKNFFSKKENKKYLSFLLTIFSIEFFTLEFATMCANDCENSKNFVPLCVALLMYRYKLDFITKEDFIRQKLQFIETQGINIETVDKYQIMLFDKLV